jgi:DNA polymerase-1
MIFWRIKMEQLNGVAPAEAAAPEQKTLALIDGANFMFRAYHAMKSMGRDFSAPDGTPTAALMNFATMIAKARDLTGAHALAIVFESTTKTFRDDLFDGYKANRPATPDPIKIQMRLARKLFPLMGVPVVWVDGFEADDLLCAYAMGAPEGWRVAMCSADKVLGQAVGPNAVVIDPNGWKVVDEAAVLAKFGVGPKMIPQFLALQGDSVDNIPGVDKCGAKTAAKLLNLHGSIEAIYEKIETLTPALKKGFQDAQPRIPDLLRLTIADLSCGMPLTPQQIYDANRSPDWAAALDMLRPLALGRLIQKAEKGLAASQARDARVASAPKP